MFDRGSYVAIEKEDRRKYIELMYSLYSPEARHLAVTHEYDWTKHDGPPRYYLLLTGRAQAIKYIGGGQIKSLL